MNYRWTDWAALLVVLVLVAWVLAAIDEHPPGAPAHPPAATIRPVVRCRIYHTPDCSYLPKLPGINP